MEQMTEQAMECLLARVGEFYKEMMAERRTNQLAMRVKMDSIQEEIIAKKDAHRERMEASMNAW
jgi:NAD(P)H-nitrite reductase large subunit